MGDAVTNTILDAYSVEPGILLIDKPKGITSFGVIRELRKISGSKKIGHAGTLDPLATGLLVLGYGAGTKKLATLFKSDKTYVAKIFFGFSTTTQDAEGEIVAQVKDVQLDKSIIQNAVKKLEGIHTFPVSVYSAIKKDGEAYYKKARRAEKVGEVLEEAPVREMVIYTATMQKTYPQTYRTVSGIEIECLFEVKSGTYIRSLAVALGDALEVPSFMSGLRRTQVGEFSIDQAYRLKEMKKDREARS